MATNEEVILGLILSGNTEVLNALRYGVRLTAGDLQQGALYAQILDLADQKHPVTPAVVSQHLGVSQESLELMVSQAWAYSQEEALSFARDLVDQHDRQAAVYRLGEAQKDILAGKKPLHKIQQEVSAGLMTKRGIVLQDASLGAIHQRLDTKIERGEKTYITPTRNPWFDFCLRGGLRSKRFIAIGGRQKGRKTSVLRNLLLGAAMDKYLNPNMTVSIAFCCFENDQEISYYDLVAMVGMELLRRDGTENTVLEGEGRARKLASDRMDGERIQTAYEKKLLEKWPPVCMDAVIAAMAIVDLLPIHIYDSLVENGGLDNLDSMEMTIEMHKQTVWKEGQHLIIAEDYAQLVENVGDDYKDMKAFSKKGLWMCQHYDATVIALSQLNEATNREKAGSKKPINYIGTKGGGSLEAAVQNYFSSAYDDKVPDKITVEQSRARRSPYAKQVFDVHPASGLLLL